VTKPNRKALTVRPGSTLVAFALVCMGLFAAACGGSGPHSPGVARLGKTTTSNAMAGGAVTTAPSPAAVSEHHQNMLKFSECMRSHGVPKFPDPGSTGGIQISASSGINPQSRQFQEAQKACQKYFPAPRSSRAQIAKHEANILKFAACMRKNGVPNYADPTFGPQGQVNETQGPGADPNSPAFQAAVKKCNS
jgi:hypothetical protein